MPAIPERAPAASPPSRFPSSTAQVIPFQTESARRLLVVEDDPFVRDIALRQFSGSGFCVTAVNAVEGAEQAPLLQKPALVIAGGVENVEGDLSSRLRRTFHAPIVPLFRPSVYARPRRGLAACNASFLRALVDCRNRIEQHLRASAQPSEMAMRWGNFTLRLEAGSFAFLGQDVRMTGVESAILYLLMRHAGEIMGHALIEHAIFRKPKSQSNFIPVHISRIRAKLRDVSSDICIENVRGDGYVLFWSRSFDQNSIPSFEVLNFSAA